MENNPEIEEFVEKVAKLLEEGGYPDLADLLRFEGEAQIPPEIVEKIGKIERGFPIHVFYELHYK